MSLFDDRYTVDETVEETGTGADAFAFDTEAPSGGADTVYEYETANRQHELDPVPVYREMLELPCLDETLRDLLETRVTDLER